MYPTNSLWEKLKLFLQLTYPVILTQLSIVASSFIAVLLTGQYNTIHLAGISIGYNMWISWFLGLSGILLGITPIISQSLGAKKKDSIPQTIYDGLCIATVLGLLSIFLGYIALPYILHMLQIDTNAQTITYQYMACIALSFLPLLWTNTLRNVVDGHGKTNYSMLIIALSVVISAITNYVCILGKWGVPALGGLGAGIGTATGYWFSFIAYVFILRYSLHFKDYQIFHTWLKPQWYTVRDQLQLGIPLGISIFAETSIFAIAGLGMAHFGTTIIAAHQSTNSFTTVVYAIPLSISIASTIIVSYEIGAKRLTDALQYAYMARLIAILLAIAICSYTFTHRSQVAPIFSNDIAVIPVIESFMTYAVFFAAIDALGTPIQGILRAYRDVKSISTIAILSYWGTAIPVAWYFLSYTDYGPLSIWFSLLSAIGVGSLAFTIRLAWIQHIKTRL